MVGGGANFNESIKRVVFCSYSCLTLSPTQCCRIITVFPFPAPSPEKLWFGFRFRLLTSYVQVPVPALYLDHKKQISKNL